MLGHPVPPPGMLREAARTRPSLGARELGEPHSSRCERAHIEQRPTSMSNFWLPPGCHPPNGYASSGTPGARHRQNGLMAALLRIIARHPVLAFTVIGLGASFPSAAIRPIADADVLPFDLPPHGFLGGVFGVGLGAFLVTGALAGRDGVIDLARPSLRWRIPVRWYLVALFTVPVGATLIRRRRPREPGRSGGRRRRGRPARHRRCAPVGR